MTYPREEDHEAAECHRCSIDAIFKVLFDQKASVGKRERHAVHCTKNADEQTH